MLTFSLCFILFYITIPLKPFVAIVIFGNPVTLSRIAAPTPCTQTTVTSGKVIAGVVGLPARFYLERFTLRHSLRHPRVLCTTLIQTVVKSFWITRSGANSLIPPRCYVHSIGYLSSPGPLPAHSHFLIVHRQAKTTFLSRGRKNAHPGESQFR